MKDFKVNGCAELTEDDLDSVNGGAWNYHDTDGNGSMDTVVIDGIGTYSCNGSTKGNVIMLILQNPNLSNSEIVELALDRGYIW